MDVLRVFKTGKKGSISSIEQRVRTQNAIYNTVKCAKMQRGSCSLSPRVTEFLSLIKLDSSSPGIFFS